MTKRTVYDVVKNRQDDTWDIRKEGSSRAISKHDVKSDAVASARILGRNAPLGQVRIRKENGQIQTEYTYGKDPFPPKG